MCCLSYPCNCLSIVIFMIGEVVNDVLLFMLYIVLFSFEMKECLLDASKFSHVYLFYDTMLMLAI